MAPYGEPGIRGKLSPTRTNRFYFFESMVFPALEKTLGYMPKIRIDVENRPFQNGMLYQLIAYY